MKTIVTSTVFCWLSQPPQGPCFQGTSERTRGVGPTAAHFWKTQSVPSGSCYVAGKQEKEVSFVAESSLLRWPLSAGLGGSEKISHVGIWGRVFQAKHGRYRGPEAGTCVA